MEASPSRQGSRLALTIGLMAVFGGLWLFLDAQDVGLPPFKRLWPALLLLAAGAALYDYLAGSRQAAAAGWAVIWTGLGILGFSLTLGWTNWKKTLDWLPSLPTTLGVAFLATWLAGGRRNDNLMLAGGLLVGLGLLGFGARFEILQRLLPSAQVVWAILLLAGGGFLVWRALAQRK